MSLQRILIPAAGLLLLALAYRSYSWGGAAAAASAIVMFLLLHLTRAMQVLKRAADRPIGYVDSAVMFNVKLRVGRTLLHVVALTRALGELRSPKDTQPELYRWTDASGSWVDAQFQDGKLREWTLVRPQEDAQAEQAGAPGAQSSAATAEGQETQR